MAKRYTGSTAITAELAAGRHGRCEHRVQGVERDELVKPLDQRRLGPTLSRRGAVEAFIINNGRMRQVAHRRSAKAIVKTPRQSAILLLGSAAVNTAEPVAAARRTIRTHTIQQNGDQKRRPQCVSWRRSQHWAWSNRVVKQNLGCSDGPLSGSTILWRTKPIDGRLPSSRKE
jgi:hypothetical protein